MLNLYRKDPFWTQKKLTPGQLQVHDIEFSEERATKGARLEIEEIQVQTLIPEENFGKSQKLQDKWQDTVDNIWRIKFSSRSEQQHILSLHNEYGWMSELRLEDDNQVECRWIHVSNKFRKNLAGILVGMGLWSKNAREIVDAVRNIESATQDRERFSKHGRMFAPFVQPLGDHPNGRLDQPVLMSVPFLDWTVHPEEETPPLRFQVDERDLYYSTRTAAHPLRSLMQHYYRLEDTSERERNQVFAKHRPWYTDRDMDLRVRRWYGHYPAGMLVDELWILVIDAQHIVTFSSNQSWKSRWPPMQFSSRVFEISVREMRDRFHAINNNKVRYSSMFHAIACLHGAIGMMHRSFWTDMPLPCTERFGGYLSHLQYRIYRSPTTRLVMELLQTQDELNIIQDITEQQLGLLMDLKGYIQDTELSQSNEDEPILPASRQSTLVVSAPPSVVQAEQSFGRIRSRSPAPPPSNAKIRLATDSVNSISNKLNREQGDIRSLKISANDLLTRTIQLVNIRTESHNQAILVFTVITVIFLPLSFMASFFGMNTTDIRNLDSGQWIFWASAVSLTVGVVLLSIIIAFYGSKISDAIADVRAGYIPHEAEWMMKIPFIGAARTKSGGKSRIHAHDLSGREIIVLDSAKVKGVATG